ncbi:MAG TPA: FGGY-family carbohydrate kinase [Polyangiaceae bacterium]|nr:FGGY-family carbohydrate kinase [Polyangiaceae bacterium]
MSEQASGEDLYLGVDVGTGSVRAALFRADGQRMGLGVEVIQLYRPAEDFVEQSSDDIFRAAGVAIRQALSEAHARPEWVRGMAFDATCSLVALDAQDHPVSVSPTGDDRNNVVVWMDHRAVEQAARINQVPHEVRRYVGGQISPEMQLPKLLWLKEHAAASFARAARFLDLADFMSYRATAVDVRSLCTTVCKWTYLGHESRWADDFLVAIGLPGLASVGQAKIGQRVRPMGERIGTLTPRAAAELGLTSGTVVGVGIIDAHAGGLGLLGTPVAGQVGQALDTATLSRRLALISGTSSCHMAVSPEPRFVPGVWGPYFSAMVPGLWLTEGGQSATGALIDHVIHSHARGAELAERALREGTSVYTLLNRELARLSPESDPRLTSELHVYPDFHGNRSPRADATLRGMVSGLKLSDSLDSLALLYLATIQGIAHGTRHILWALEQQGYRIETILACGGDTKNPLFLREHADITGCTIALPREPEAVLLGAAMLGSVACGRYATVVDAMRAMSAPGSSVAPRPTFAAYHERKHEVFHRMYLDQLAYRDLMESAPHKILP